MTLFKKVSIYLKKFKYLRPSSNNAMEKSKWRFVNPITNNDLAETEDHALLEKYSELIGLAAGSKPTPRQSGYPVHTAAMTESGIMVKGSNHEHGVTDTLTHGEEGAIAAALEEAGENDPVKIIAFASPHEKLITPCGNCRDIIAEYCSKELVIVSGRKEGGLAYVMPGKEYFLDNFRRLKLSGLEDTITFKGFLGALKAERTAYDIYTSPEKIYGAAIVTQKGEVFRGSFRGDVAYHAVCPISAAISNFRDGSDDPGRLNVKEMVIASTCHQPKIPYKERQHMLEFAEGIQAYNNKSGQPLPVKIFQADEQGQVIKGWKTDTNQWYPLPFSPAHLGMENKLKEGIGKLVGKIIC